MKYNMVFLRGTYDVEFKFVEEEVFQWIETGQLTPENEEKIREMLKAEDAHLQQVVNIAWGNKEDNEIEEILKKLVNVKDTHNDRAIKAPSIFIEGELMAFTDIKPMMDAAQKHQIEIKEVYEGYIY